MKMCLWWSKFQFGKHRWSRAAKGGLFAALLAVAGVSTQAQTLNLQFSNSSNLYSNNDIWITFTTGQQGYEFTASYGSTVLSNVGTPQGMYWSNSYQYWVPPSGSVSGSYVNSAANLWMSEPIQLSSLINAGGLTVTKADSVRAYVSLGSAMTVLPTGTGESVLYNNSMAVFGQPSISNTSDPNYNIRWDLFEIAVTPAVSDQGDVTAINATAIPMKMESFTATSSTPVQSIQTSSNYAALLAAAQEYYNANAANNTNPQLPTNPMVMNGTNFLRAMGITNGQQAASAVTPDGNGFIYTSAGGAGAVATIGVNATFGDYVAYVHDNNITTPLVNAAVQAYDGSYNYGFYGSAYTASWNSGQVVSASWQIYDGGNTYWSSGTLTSQVTGGTGAAVVVEGDFIQTVAAPGGSFTNLGTLGRYKMILPPDYTNPTGQDYANYLQSAILYSGAQASNFGVIFEYTPFDVNSGTFLTTSTYLNYSDFVAAAEHFSATVPSGSSLNADTVMSKVVHDLASGYNFGLIGSTVVDPATGLTFNDEGSEIWTFVWAKLTGGATSTVYNGTTFNSSTLGVMPLFEALQEDNPYYNQWAKLIYDSSASAYGGTYSDYLQTVLVNLLAAPNQTEYNIDHVTLTILDVNTVVPEASAVTLLLVAGAGWMLTRSRKNRKNGISS